MTFASTGHQGPDFALSPPPPEAELIRAENTRIWKEGRAAFAEAGCNVQAIEEAAARFAETEDDQFLCEMWDQGNMEAPLNSAGERKTPAAEWYMDRLPEPDGGGTELEELARIINRARGIPAQS